MTVVSVQCKYSPKLHPFTKNSDQPGLAEVVAEGEMVKGGDALLACLLEDQGRPEATHFLWTK